jgi:hypothetical protein
MDPMQIGLRVLWYINLTPSIHGHHAGKFSCTLYSNLTPSINRHYADRPIYSALLKSDIINKRTPWGKSCRPSVECTRVTPELSTVTTTHKNNYGHGILHADTVTPRENITGQAKCVWYWPPAELRRTRWGKNNVTTRRHHTHLDGYFVVFSFNKPVLPVLHSPVFWLPKFSKLDVKGIITATTHRAILAYRGAEGRIHSYRILTTGGAKWSSSRFCRITPGGGGLGVAPPQSHWLSVGGLRLLRDRWSVFEI